MTTLRSTSSEALDEEKPTFIPARPPAQQVIVVPMGDEAWLGDDWPRGGGEDESDIPAGDTSTTDLEAAATESRPVVVADIVVDSRSELARTDDPDDPTHPTTANLPARREPARQELIAFAPGGELALNLPPLPFAQRPRRWPVAVLVTILVIVVANTVFTVYSMWQSRRSVDELRSALVGDRDEQMTMLIQEIRREVRSRALADTLQLRTELKAVVEAQSRRQSDELLAQLKGSGTAATEPPAEKLLREAQQASSVTNPNARPSKSVASKQKPAPAPAKAKPDNADAAIALADPGTPDVVFLIDASTLPDDAMPMVLTELRRAIDQLSKRKRWTILVYHDQLLTEVPQQSIAAAGEDSGVSAASIASPSPDLDLPPKPCADIGDAFRQALSSEPLDLYLLASDISRRRRTGGRLTDPLAILRQINGDRATHVHAIQFFARDEDDLLLKIARENGGTYTLVTSPTSK